MSSKNEVIRLEDDLVLKISSLLLADIGATRQVEVAVATLPLDTDLAARDVNASIRLTRLDTGILAEGTATGVVAMECVRCLNVYDQPFSARFAERFRETVDIADGRVVQSDGIDEGNEFDDELAFEINDAHEIDLTELLRQWIVLDLPMMPNCGDDCTGPSTLSSARAENEVDERLAALQSLLDAEE